MRVRLKKSASDVTNTAAMPATDTSNLEMFMPVAFVINSQGSSWIPISSPCGCAPHSICASPSMKKVSPMVAMNSVIGG